MAADISAIGAGLAFAYWFRFGSGVIEATKGYDPADYRWILPWTWGVWFLALRFENLYRRRSKILDFNVLRRIATGSIFAVLMMFAIVFYVRRVTDFSRVLIPIAYLSVVGFLIVERICLDRLFRYLTRRREFGLTRALILGGGRLARRVYQSLEEHPEHGLAPIGLLVDTHATGDSDRDPPSGDPDGIRTPPILGTVDDLTEVIKAERIDEVILAQPELDRARIPALLDECERCMASFRIVPDTTELLFSGMTVETLNGIPFLGARETPLKGWNAALKRLIDFVGAVVGLIALSPVLAVIALMIAVRDGRPIFYHQDRMGIDGHGFRIWKFRTMHPDAESASGPVFADDRDDRCSPLGATLRKYRLDELPQLVNVVMGDMSVVGPRPERPYFIEKFRDDIPKYMTRHKVRSGITGWAQINGLAGKHGSIAERLEYDLYYIENWSIWLDIKIVALTLYRSYGPAG